VAGAVLALVGAVWLWGPWPLVLAGLALLIGPEVPGLVVLVRDVIREVSSGDAAADDDPDAVRPAA
jgi:hypothetical protein